METSKFANPSVDWKLNPNVECRITVNKLRIETPEYETMKFCRTLGNLTVPMEPAPAVVSTTTETTDMHFKSEFVLDVLLNEILGKCKEKCKDCEEYVQQLRRHIIQAHSASPHTVTEFKCDVCSSIYSSPSMLIRHRNTHPYNPDTLTTPSCTNEPERVRFDSNNIYASFDISSVSRTNESENSSSGQCANNPLQPLTVPPQNFELDFLKQELASSQSELEMSNPNPLGILQHMNHLSTIENNLKQECDDLECQEDLHDPLLLQDLVLQVSSFVKYESTEICTESEQQTVFMTHEKSSNDTTAGRESNIVPSDLIKHTITQSVQKPHKCDICGKCFGNLHLLSRHKLTHSGKKPHKCGVCGKCFTFNSHLKQHRVTHTGEKSFCCDVCGRGFALETYLANHKSIHTGERPYECDVCEKTFRRSDHLTQHKVTHTGEKSFHCDVCGLGISRRSDMTRHKLVHNGEKPHECNVCGKGFNQNHHLRKHKLTHTGERPYGCDLCEKSFRQSAHLAKHKLTHTGVTGEKSFHCDECGQNFYDRHEITKHKLKHAWQSTTVTLVNHLKEERESEEEGCQEDPLLNLQMSS